MRRKKAIVENWISEVYWENSTWQKKIYHPSFFVFLFCCILLLQVLLLSKSTETVSHQNKDVIGDYDVTNCLWNVETSWQFSISHILKMRDFSMKLSGSWCKILRWNTYLFIYLFTYFFSYYTAKPYYSLIRSQLIRPKQWK